MKIYKDKYEIYMSTYIVHMIHILDTLSIYRDKYEN